MLLDLVNQPTHTHLPGYECLNAKHGGKKKKFHLNYLNRLTNPTWMEMVAQVNFNASNARQVRTREVSQSGAREKKGCRLFLNCVRCWCYQSLTADHGTSTHIEHRVFACFSFILKHSIQIDILSHDTFYELYIALNACFANA